MTLWGEASTTFFNAVYCLFQNPLEHGCEAKDDNNNVRIETLEDAKTCKRTLTFSEPIFKLRDRPSLEELLKKHENEAVDQHGGVETLGPSWSSCSESETNGIEDKKMADAPSEDGAFVSGMKSSLLQKASLPPDLTQAQLQYGCHWLGKAHLPVSRSVSDDARPAMVDFSVFSRRRETAAGSR